MNNLKAPTQTRRIMMGDPRADSEEQFIPPAAGVYYAAAGGNEAEIGDYASGSSETVQETN